VVKYPKPPVAPTSPNPVPQPVLPLKVPPPPNTVPVKPPPGAKLVKTLGSIAPYVPPQQPAHTSYSPPPAAKQLASLKAESPVTVNGSGQESTTGIVAYHSLVNQGYTPQQAVSVAAQIAAANSGVPAGTPQLVAGVPVTAGASTNVNPESQAQAAQAAAASAAAQAAQNSKNLVAMGQTSASQLAAEQASGQVTGTQLAIAKSAASNPQNFGGGWTNVGNGTIRNNATGQILPAGTNGIW
jgi:hypothetical protein